MDKIKNFIDTPSQTAGPFLHIGCTPSITGINIFKDELGSAPFKNISLNEEINIMMINGIIACWVFTRLNHSLQLLKNLSLWNFLFSFSNNLAFLAKDFVTHFSKGIFFIIDIFLSTSKSCPALKLGWNVLINSRVFKNISTVASFMSFCSWL